MTFTAVPDQVRTGDWLDAQVFPPLEFAVPGIVPEGFGLLVGPPKAGKSWAALAIALAVASGGHALGVIPVGHARPVLYLALEDGDRRLQDRCRSLLDDVPIPSLLNYTTRVTSGAAPSLIADWLDQHGHHHPLVLVDTLAKIAPPASPGESAYGRDYRIGGAIKRLADDHPGTTVLAVHHDRKASAEDFVDAVSGTHGLAGSADFVLVLERKRQESTAVLKVTGRDIAEAEYAITLSDRGRWTLAGETLRDASQRAATVKAQAGVGDRLADVIGAVAARPAGCRAQDITDELAIPIAQARVYLSRAANAGRIDKLERGLYIPVMNVMSVRSESPGTPRYLTDETVITPPQGDRVIHLHPTTGRNHP